MKLAMELTLDGMLRALRGKAHALADEIEGDYSRRASPVVRRPGGETRRPLPKRPEDGDDRASA